MDPHDGSSYIYFNVTAVLLIFNALVVLTNAAFNNVNINRINELLEKDEHSRKAHRVAVIMEKPFRYICANRIINYILTVVGVYLVLIMPFNNTISIIVYLTVLMSLGDILPRKIGVNKSEQMALMFSGFQRFIMYLMLPVTAIVTVVADIFLKSFRQKTKVELTNFSEEQVMSMLEAGQKKGEIKEEGKKMINSIFEFDDELAYEIMTPRTDVFMIDMADPADEYIEELMGLRFSRVPVCEDDSDNIIGILYIKDYLIQARNEGFDNVNIRDILRKPYFVPETKNIDSLFFELQKEKQHIAILIDEYGGFSGIVTMEDIIEEVMGEIDDEYDTEEVEIRKINDKEYYVNGKADLDDLRDEYGICLESEISETVGGFLIDILGEIPGEDDTDRIVKYENYIFTILSVKDRRIEKVKIEISDPEDGERDDKKNE